MTFEEFQKSRKWHDDLESVIKCAELQAGFAYADGTLYIEACEWGYALTLDRDIYEAFNLEKLERKLYDFALEEGWLS
jgi:hypothetical protein